MQLDTNTNGKITCQKFKPWGCQKKSQDLAKEQFSEPTLEPNYGLSILTAFLQPSAMVKKLGNTQASLATQKSPIVTFLGLLSRQLTADPWAS